VPPSDPAALAAKIREVVADPDRMAWMSTGILAKAEEYRDEVLRERRAASYRYVREMTGAWLASSGSRTISCVDVRPDWEC
jgi:glycosyltransferase involved in cell wall biosynthesis